MQTLPDFDPTYASAVIPPDARFEDRGTIWYDPITASTVQKVSSFCKDIQGCGDKDYRSVSAATTLNFLEGCVPTLNGVWAVKGLFFEQATNSQLVDIASFLSTKSGLSTQASTSCP